MSKITIDLENTLKKKLKSLII